MKKFIINEEEKRRILNMHINATKKNYLLEDENSMMGEKTPDQMAHDKVERVMPKVENKLEDIVSKLSDEEISNIKSSLESMGITSDTSLDDVHQIVQDEIEEEPMGEMTEEEKEQSDRQKIANFLEGIGGANIAAWGGVPLAIAVGGIVGSFAVGLAASWGTTALVYGLAKLLSDK